jgi:hypothetical protein
VLPRREEAFLLSAIALETIMLPGSGSNELAYRLRLRVAHLLGETLDERREIIRKIRNLYNIRSKIVHDGAYEVTDAELRQIRSFAKKATWRLLETPYLRKCPSLADMETWFESQILR